MKPIHLNLTPNYLKAAVRLSIFHTRPSDIPLAWEALCRARFREEPGVQSVRLLKIARPGHRQGPSWQRASWNRLSTERALLLVVEVGEFLPAAQMREILLATQRLFAEGQESPVYFTVVAAPQSSRCVKRLYPASDELRQNLSRAPMLFSRDTLPKAA